MSRKQEIAKKAAEYAEGKLSRIIDSVMRKNIKRAFKDGYKSGFSDGYETGKRNERELQCGKKHLENLRKENKALEDANEKMKCCDNCKHRLKVLEMEVLDLQKDELREPCNICDGYDKWELIERNTIFAKGSNNEMEGQNDR